LDRIVGEHDVAHGNAETGLGCPQGHIEAVEIQTAARVELTSSPTLGPHSPVITTGERVQQGQLAEVVTALELAARQVARGANRCEPFRVQLRGVLRRPVSQTISNAELRLSIT